MNKPIAATKLFIKDDVIHITDPASTSVAILKNTIARYDALCGISPKATE